jgi:hypothetical protein
MGRCETFLHFQCVAAFMGSPRSQDNPVAETNTQAQGGREDGSVAAGHRAVALLHGAATAAKALPELSDDKQTSRP